MNSENISRDTKTYNFLKTEKAYIWGQHTENVVSAILHCQLLDKKDEKHIYKLITKNYQQANNKGFYGLMEDLQLLQSNLTISVSESGLVDDILNVEEIKAKWQSVKDKIMAKHRSELYGKEAEEEITEWLEDKEQFVSSIKYLPPFISLFSGFSAQTGAEQHYREMPFFIAVQKMPILLEANKVENGKIENATEIIADGEIDEDNYEQPEVTEFVKTVRDNLRAKAQPQLRYTERYAFNGSPLPIQTMFIKMVSIPDFLYQEEKTFLKEML